MAKTVMPLLSAEASGKIANTMVFFYWKGLNVVRRWVVPRNPRDIKQKLIRTRLMAMGKNLAAITTKAPAGAIVALIKDLTPPNMIWNAHFCRKTIEHVKTNANWTALNTAYNAAVTQLTQFEASAALLDMADVLPGVAFNETVTKGLQLHLGAYAAHKLGLSGLTDYATYPTNWGVGKITSFAKDYTAA